MKNLHFYLLVAVLGFGCGKNSEKNCCGDKKPVYGEDIDSEDKLRPFSSNRQRKIWKTMKEERKLKKIEKKSCNPIKWKETCYINPMEVENLKNWSKGQPMPIIYYPLKSGKFMANHFIENNIIYSTANSNNTVNIEYEDGNEGGFGL